MSLEKTLRILIEVIDKASKPAEKATKELKDLEKQAKKTEQNMKHLDMRPDVEINKDIARARRAYRELAKSGKLSALELSRAYDSMREKVKEYEKELRNTEALQDKLSSSAGGMMKALALLSAFVLPVQQAASFQRVMSEVRAIADATDDEFAALTESARTMGATTEFSAIQAANGLKKLVIGGLDAAEAIGALPSVLQLAQAGSMDLANAADVLTNIMLGYGIEVDQLSRVNDVLVQTFTHTNSTLEELGNAFAYVGPIAKGVGADFDKLAATIGALHNAGLKGTLAGTALRGMLDTLFNPTKQEAKMMEILEKRLGGVSLRIRDAEGNFVGFESIVRQLAQAGLDGAEALKLFGLRAGPGMAALISIGADALKDLNRLNAEAGGRAKEIAKVMHDNLIGSWKDFLSVSQSLAIEVGNALLPVLRDLLAWVTEMLRTVSDWAALHPQLVSGIIKVVAATGTLVLGVSAYKTAMAGASLVSAQLIPKLTAIVGGTAAVEGAAGGAAAAATGLSLSLGTLLAAGLALAAGWAAGSFVSSLTMPFDESKRSIGEWVQTGYAKIGQFWNWLTGGSTQANQMVIDGIRQQAEARHVAGQIAKLEIQREVELQRELQTATKAVNAEISATQKEWDTVKQKLSMVQNEYDTLLQVAHEKIQILAESTKTALNAAWENMGNGQAIQAIQAQLQAINREYQIAEQQRRTEIIAAENRLAQARAAAAVAAMNQTTVALQNEYQRRIQLAEAQHNTEIGIIERTAATAEQAAMRKTASEADYAAKVKNIEQSILEAKKGYYSRAREALERELQASLDRERQIAEEIKNLNETIAQSRMSAEDKIRALRQKAMTDEQRYRDQVAQVQEKIAQAADAAATDTQKSISLYKEAQSLAAGLGQEIKEGERVVVSKQQAIAQAISLIEQAQRGMEDAARARQAVLEQSLSETQANTDQLKSTLAEITDSLDSIAAKIADGINVKFTIAEDEFNKSIEKIKNNSEILINVKGEFSDISNKLGELNKQKMEIMKDVEFSVNAKYEAALSELKTVEAEINKLDGRVITTRHKIISTMTGSSEKPTLEKIAEIDSAFKGLDKNISGDHAAKYNMYGDVGSGSVGLVAAMDQGVRVVGKMQAAIKKPASANVDASGAIQQIGELADEADRTAAQISEPISMNIDISPAKQALKELADEAYRNAVAAEKASMQMWENVQRGTGTWLDDITQRNYENLVAQGRHFEQQWKKYSKMSAHVDFTGSGSSTRPLGEKISEMATLAGKFKNNIEQMPAQVEFTDENGKPLGQAIPNLGRTMAEMMAGAGKTMSEILAGSGIGNIPGMGTALSPAGDMGLKDMGTLTIQANGKEGKIIGKEDVLAWIKELVNDSNKLGLR